MIAIALFHCTVCAFSFPFCHEDFLFIVMGLPALCKLLHEKNLFSRGRDLSGIVKREGTDSVSQSRYS